MNITSSSYNKLSQLVASKQLEIIHVIGLPRANGTALQIALTQAQEISGQLNEPFYYPDMKGRKWDYRPTEKPVRTFEDGCAFILKAYEEDASRTQTTVRLVVHDLSQDLSAEELKKLNKIDKHTVFMVRAPLVNALSMLTRYVNDKISQPGGNQLKSSEVLQIIKNAESFEIACKSNSKISLPLVAQHVKKDEKDLLSEDFTAARKKILDIYLTEYTLAWENMHHLYNMMNEESSESSKSVFDGNWLFDNTEEHLQDLVKRIGGLTYTSNMINRWTKGIGDRFRCIITRTWGTFSQTNAWNGPARTSTGITKHQDSMNDKVQLAEFPVEAWDPIQKSITMYSDILSTGGKK